jgi:FkbM family methyltransferase
MNRENIHLSYDSNSDLIYITPQINYDFPIKIIVRDPATGLTIYYWKDIQSLSAGCNYFLKPFNAFSFTEFEDFIAFQVEVYDSNTREMIYKNLLPIRPGEVKSDFQFVISDYWHDCAYFQYYEMNHLGMYDFVNKNLKDKVVVDIGAAYGVYTKRAIDLGASKVYSIEPSQSFDFIRMSFCRDERVVPIKCAISSQNGEANFYYSDSLTTSRLQYEPNSKVEVVPIRRLDEILSNEPEIEFIKMDIEGEEYKVIESLDKRFFDKVKCWAIEFHQNNGTNVQSIINKMSSSGYRNTIRKNTSLEFGNLSELTEGYILFWKP